MFRIFFLILGIILISWCSQKVKEQVNYDSIQTHYTVTSWSVSSDNKFVGSLQSQDESFLSFKMPWRIMDIYVKEWDKVSKWELLAVLDGNEVKTQFSSANSMLGALESMYENTSNMFDAQIASMKTKIEQSKLAMEWSKTWLKDTQDISKEQIQTAQKQVEQAKVWVDSALSNLEHTKEVLSWKQENIYSNAKNAISSSNILQTNFLIFVDEIFGISDEREDDNNGFEDYLWAKNQTLKQETENLWLQINKDYKQFLNSFEDVENLNNQQIEDKLKTIQNILERSRKLADKVYTTIDNSVSSSSFPQSKIDTYKQQTVTYQNQIEQALLTAEGEYLLWVKGSLQSIEDFKKEKNMQIDLLEKKYNLAQTSLETAKQTLNQYKASSTWKVNEVNTQYEVSKQQYEEAKSGLQALKKQKESQLSKISSQIQEVKWNKNLAAVNLWNIKLYAPYDGIILTKNANVWQVIWAWTPIFKIWTLDNLKWVFHVPLSEVETIKPQDTVYIKALWETITWTIDLIHPQADPITKKVTVEVKLSNIKKNWKNGMYITWYPKNEQISWLLVPYDLLRYEYGKAYIYKKRDDGFEKTYITLWECDDDYCIVEKWLSYQDVIKY